MSVPTTLKLTEAVIGHQGAIQELAFRKPTYADYIALGPVERVVYRDGAGSIETDRDVLAGYAERLLVDQGLQLMLGQLTLKDALALERMVLAFFEAAATPTPQPTT